MSEPERLQEQLAELGGKPMVRVTIDVDDFEVFKGLYVDDRAMIDDAKRLEYYVSYRWLELDADDVFIDVAAQNCPFADFVRDHFGATAYRQDLYYMERGIHGHDIGGNAARIPLPSDSVTKIALYNSFEHFEGNSDTRFIREASRLLTPGGKLLIVPLFIDAEYSTERRAGWIDEEGHKHRWGRGARFSRIYDDAHFERRVLKAAPLLDPQFFHIENAADIDPSAYPYFVIFERQAG